MPKCFVIQPFDGGKFDKRYDDVFAPAIKEAGLEPYRVDRDPGVVVPINEIRTGIQSAAACLADITTDNPNVWFELGVALSSHKPVILLCSKERGSRFPFDVQHLSIITYTTESSSDFDRLRKAIAERMAALLEREGELDRVAQISPVTTVEGLQAHEIAGLVSVAQQLDAPGDSVSAHTVRQEMENAGFTRLATTLALRSLVNNSMLEVGEEQDYNGNRFFTYRLTDRGANWLFANQEKLPLRAEAHFPKPNHSPKLITDDDVPF